MKVLNSLLLPVLASLSLSLCHANTANTAERSAAEAQMRVAAKQYAAALQEKDGEAAVAVVDQQTVKYYGDIADYSRYATPAELEALPLLTASIVGQARHALSATELEAMTGKKLYIWTITAGLTGSGSLDIEDVKINGDTADAAMVIDGRALPRSVMVLRFKKEEGQWKLSIVSLIEQMQGSLERMLLSDSSDRLAVALKTVQQVFPEATDAIWKPPFSR